MMTNFIFKLVLGFLLMLCGLFADFIVSMKMILKHIHFHLQ